MLTIHEVKQGSNEWHALRTGLVTASNAGVLLAKGKNAARGTQGVRAGNYWSERGHILEDEAIEIYNSVYNTEVERPGFITNDEYPDCGYSPDGTLPELALEVKCFKEERHLLCLDDTPMEVYAQVQFGLMVTGWLMGHLIFYNPDIEDSDLCFRVIEVPRDELLIKRFREKLGMEAKDGKA